MGALWSQKPIPLHPKSQPRTFPKLGQEHFQDGGHPSGAENGSSVRDTGGPWGCWASWRHRPPGTSPSTLGPHQPHSPWLRLSEGQQISLECGPMNQPKQMIRFQFQGHSQNSLSHSLLGRKSCPQCLPRPARAKALQAPLWAAVTSPLHHHLRNFLAACSRAPRKQWWVDLGNTRSR